MGSSSDFTNKFGKIYKVSVASCTAVLLDVFFLISVTWILGITNF